MGGWKSSTAINPDFVKRTLVCRPETGSLALVTACSCPCSLCARNSLRHIQVVVHCKDSANMRKQDPGSSWILSFDHFEIGQKEAPLLTQSLVVESMLFCQEFKFKVDFYLQSTLFALPQLFCTDWKAAFMPFGAWRSNCWLKLHKWDALRFCALCHIHII